MTMEVTADRANTALNEQSPIFAGVSRCICKATGLPSSEISMEKTLIHDLKIDSIDLIDLLYQIEDEFNVEIKIGELERRARAVLGEKPFAIDNIITPEGLAVLQDLIPDAPREKFVTGLMSQQIPYLFSVKSICRLVASKLDPQ